MIHVLPIDHRDLRVAIQMHAILSLAYAQEAALMNVERFVDHDETVEEIQGSDEFCLGALRENALVGFLTIGRDEEPDQISISTLVVHPAHQRQGVGHGLVHEAVRRSQGMTLSVSTGANNLPALSLYKKFGFHEYRFGTIGPENLALVKLKSRAP
jgi:ribosomal protein S18 acetylase RimI-like enzyme